MRNGTKKTPPNSDAWHRPTTPRSTNSFFALRFTPQRQTMAATLIDADPRREELLRLTHDDTDLSRRNGGHGLIQVRAKTINGRFWQPKTIRDRALPISKALRGYLDQYNAPTSDHGWFFLRRIGKWPDTRKYSQFLHDSNGNNVLHDHFLNIATHSETRSHNTLLRYTNWSTS